LGGRKELKFESFLLLMGEKASEGRSVETGLQVSGQAIKGKVQASITILEGKRGDRKRKSFPFSVPRRKKNNREKSTDYRKVNESFGRKRKTRVNPLLQKKDSGRKVSLSRREKEGGGGRNGKKDEASAKPDGLKKRF